MFYSSFLILIYLFLYQLRLSWGRHTTEKDIGRAKNRYSLLIKINLFNKNGKLKKYKRKRNLNKMNWFLRLIKCILRNCTDLIQCFFNHCIYFHYHYFIRNTIKYENRIAWHSMAYKSIDTMWLHSLSFEIIKYTNQCCVELIPSLTL